MIKKTKVILIGLSLVFMLGGCEIMGPSVKVEPPKVKVDGVRIEGSNNGTHCPPGQAKKGNC